jgi:chemotaxis protein CheX
MTDFNQRYLVFCKPFIEAIKEVYSTMLMTELAPAAPVIKEGSVSNGDYSSIMGINGSYEGEGLKKKFKGTLVLSWPEEVYLNTASAMLMEDFTEITEEIADVGMEICNITMGNAKKVLSELGYYIEMSIPTSVRGRDHELKPQKGITTIVTPLDSKLGKFFVELTYEDFEE